MIRFNFWWYTEISFAAMEKEAHDCIHVYVFLCVFFISLVDAVVLNHRSCFASLSMMSHLFFVCLQLICMLPHFSNERTNQPGKLCLSVI